MIITLWLSTAAATCPVDAATPPATRAAPLTVPAEAQGERWFAASDRRALSPVTWSAGADASSWIEPGGWMAGESITLWSPDCAWSTAFRAPVDGGAFHLAETPAALVDDPTALVALLAHDLDRDAAIDLTLVPRNTDGRQTTVLWNDTSQAALVGVRPPTCVEHIGRTAEVQRAAVVWRPDAAGADAHLVVAHSADARLTVHRGSGARDCSELPWLTPPEPTPHPLEDGEVRGMATGDVDGDGAIDLIIAADGDGSGKLLIADGATPPPSPLTPRAGPAVGARAMAIATVDADHDGRQDVAVAAGRPIRVGIALAGDDGALGVPTLFSPPSVTTGCSPDRISVGDLDRDGTAWLVLTATGCADLYTIPVADLLQPAPEWTVTPLGCADPGPATLGDLDGDGDLDAAVPCSDRTVLLARDAGGYAERDTLPTPGVTRVEAVDIDADGVLDLIVASDAELRVRRGQTTPPPADDSGETDVDTDAPTADAEDPDVHCDDTDDIRPEVLNNRDDDCDKYVDEVLGTGCDCATGRAPTPWPPVVMGVMFLLARRRIAVVTLLPATAGAVGEVSAPHGDRVAVVIGVNQPPLAARAWPDQPVIRGAQSDAAAIADVLEDPAYGGFTVHRLIADDGPITRELAMETIGALARMADRDDTLVVYFAGHGFLMPSSDGDHHLLELSDFDPARPLETGLDRRWITDKLAAADAGATAVILDSCHGYAPGIPRSRGLTTDPSRVDAVLFAAAHSYQAQERNDQGIYTRHLIRALRGLGDPTIDINQDGAISALEAHHWASLRTMEDTTRDPIGDGTRVALQVPAVKVDEKGQRQIILSGRPHGVTSTTLTSDTCDVEVYTPRGPVTSPRDVPTVVPAGRARVGCVGRAATQEWLRLAPSQELIWRPRDAGLTGRSLLWGALTVGGTRKLHREDNEFLPAIAGGGGVGVSARHRSGFLWDLSMDVIVGPTPRAAVETYATNWTEAKNGCEAQVDEDTRLSRFCPEVYATMVRTRTGLGASVSVGERAAVEATLDLQVVSLFNGYHRRVPEPDRVREEEGDAEVGAAGETQVGVGGTLSAWLPLGRTWWGPTGSLGAFPIGDQGPAVWHLSGRLGVRFALPPARR